MSQSPAVEEPRGLLLGGRYRLGRPLGSGAMGVVFAATDERMHRDVAVKVVRAAHMKDPEALERFEREARHAGRLGHANVVAVTDMGRTDEGFPFVVMERLEGRTLEARIEEGPLPIVEAIQVHVQLLDALACAHDAGVLHRDVKPANVFLSRLATGAALVKLLDFGIAQTSGDRKLTMDGAVVGSPVYLAPERFRGQPARIESDLYSVGVSLFESLAGDVPLDGKMGAALMQRVLHEVPPRLDTVRPDVPAPLAGVVARALEKSPEARFSTARQMREALLAIDQSAMPKPDARRPGGTLLGIADPSVPITTGAQAALETKATWPDGAPVMQGGPVAVTVPKFAAQPPSAQAPSAPERSRRPQAETERLGPARPAARAPTPSRLSTPVLLTAAALVVVLFVGLGALAALLRRPTAPVSPPTVPAPTVPAPVSTTPPAPPSVAPSSAPSPSTSLPPLPSSLPVGVDPPPDPEPAPAGPVAGEAHPPHHHHAPTTTGAAEPAAVEPPPATPPATPPETPRDGRPRVGADGLLVPNW